MQEQRENPPLIERLENPIIPWLIAAFFAVLAILTDITFRILPRLSFGSIAFIRTFSLVLYTAPIVISILILIVLLIHLKWKRALITLISILGMVVILFVPQCTLTQTQEKLIDNTVRGNLTPYSFKEQRALIQASLTVLGKQFPRESITNYTIFLSNQTWFLRLESTQGNTQTPFHFIQTWVKAEKKLQIHPPVKATLIITTLHSLLEESLRPWMAPKSLVIQSIELKRGFVIYARFKDQNTGKLFDYQETFYFHKHPKFIIWPDYPKISPEPSWNPSFLAIFESKINNIPPLLEAGPIAHALKVQKMTNFSKNNSLWNLKHRTYVFHHDETKPETILNSDVLITSISPLREKTQTNHFILSLKERIPTIEVSNSSNNQSLFILKFPKLSIYPAKERHFLLISNQVQFIREVSQK